MEEKQPPPRRPRSPRAAFSTSDQQGSSAPPARKPPATPPPITFRPPGPTVDRGKSTATDHPTADESTQADGSTPAAPPRKQQPASRRNPANRPPAKRTPSGANTEAPKRTPSGANTEAPKPAPPRSDGGTTAGPAKKAAAAKAVTNPTPAKKTAAAKKANPTKKATPAGSSATSAKKTTPARKAAPLKHALKAAAAEVAPALVEPDMTTVPDEQPTAASSGPDKPADTPATTASASTTTVSEPDEPSKHTPAQRHPIESATHTEAWARLIADPGHSPELLALAAVQTLGPQAQEWAERMRDAYPNATPDGLARLASQQFVRFGTVGSVFGAVAGSYAPLTLLGAAALAHAELSLHVAAAYGVDPADPARAADLLLLTRVHPTREDAEAALVAAREHSYDDSGITDALWRLGRMVAVHAGVWTVLRGVNRLFPGASLLAAVLTSRAAAHTVAARANLFYRQPPGHNDRR
ncbi:hypothetical protein [Actinoplanes sp. NPDC049316]|uniref:hypothetical protein n=1 Tax=Actinoplanes sp. NPDC049316 TaxID=3154727 RepID=UPI003432A014